MSWWPFGKKKNEDTTTVVDNPDGSQTVTTSFELTGDTRPVRTDVVEALDNALGALGGEVMHAIDPRRILGFEEGGPPVWSVGIVEVPGANPYTLLVTYGFSEVASPEACRQGFRHEYSLALPAGTNPSPWADALLRHLSRYVLTSGQELCLGDVMPCHAPITRVPFPPQHHDMMPDTSLMGVITTSDPVLGTVATPHGEIEMRRILGIDSEELDRAETWSGSGFVEEYAKRDPLLLTDLNRVSAMSDLAFSDVANARATAEGSEIPAVALDVRWEDTGSELVIEFPGDQQAQKLLNALRGRLPFGRTLLVVSHGGPPIGFKPAESFDINWSPQGLFIDGNLDEPNVARIVGFIRPDSPGSVVRLPLRS